MNDKPFGLANDDTQYSAESPEVVKYLEMFPDVELDAAIGSVVTIHNNVIAGAEVAGDVKEITDMISAKLLADSEEVPADENEEPENDGLEDETKPEGEDSPADSEEESSDNGNVADPAHVNEIKE